MGGVGGACSQSPANKTNLQGGAGTGCLGTSGLCAQLQFLRQEERALGRAGQGRGWQRGLTLQLKAMLFSLQATEEPHRVSTGNRAEEGRASQDGRLCREVPRQKVEREREREPAESRAVWRTDQEGASWEGLPSRTGARPQEPEGLSCTRGEAPSLGGSRGAARRGKGALGKLAAGKQRRSDSQQRRGSFRGRKRA